MKRQRRGSSRSGWAAAIVMAVLALLVAAMTVIAPAPVAIAAKPTTTTTTAGGVLERNGPCGYTSAAVADAATPGFGAATIYSPTDPDCSPTATGVFGGVAISPGFRERQSAISWFGPRLASHGFVAITFDTNFPGDSPSARGTQLLAALDYLAGSSAVSAKVDATRLAVMGHSMGGGGAIEASNVRRTLKASIPMTPWDETKTWPDVQTPTLIIGAEADLVAPVADYAIPLHDGLTGARERAYLEIDNANHNVTNQDNARTSTFTIAWLKRFLDGNTSFDSFLCPAPATGGSTGISQYISSCPHE